MSVIFILICFSLLVAVGFLAAFIWSVRSGQYNDTYTPSVRVLFDEKISHKVSSLRGEGRDSMGSGTSSPLPLPTGQAGSPKERE